MTLANGLHYICVFTFIFMWIQQTICEEYYCDRSHKSSCSSPIVCIEPDSDCNIICDDEKSCANATIIIASNKGSKRRFNLTCNGKQACENVELKSDRNGIVLCNDFKDNCNNIEITSMEKNTFNFDKFGTSVECYGHNSCKNIDFYCDNGEKCNFYCDNVNDCGDQDSYFNYTCINAKICSISGNPHAWVCQIVKIIKSYC